MREPFPIPRYQLGYGVVIAGAEVRPGKGYNVVGVECYLGYHLFRQSILESLV